MINTYQRNIYAILGIAPFLLLYFITNKINLKKEERSLQILAPVAAVLYCAVVYALLQEINVFLIDLLNKVFGLTMDLGKNTNIKEWVGGKTNITASIINSIFILLGNTVIVFGFLILKVPVIRLSKNMLKQNATLLKIIYNGFYECDDATGSVYIKQNCEQIIVYIKGFFYSAVLISSILLVMSQAYRENILFQAAFYPVFGLLILGEIVAYLDGKKRDESEPISNMNLSENTSLADFEAANKILTEIYPEKVLYKNSAVYLGVRAMGKEGDNSQEQKEDGRNKIIDKYFKDLEDNGYSIDDSYVKITYHLIKNENVLVFSPFYRDLTHYLILPIIKNLMEYRKCLVIVGRDSSTEDVREWLSESIAHLTNTPSLWKTTVLDKQELECDIAILKHSEIYNLNLLQGYSDFFKRVGFILILDPSRLLATGQLGLSWIVGKCVNEKYTPVFCAIDKNCDGLVDSISHTVRSDFTHVFASKMPEAKNFEIAWDAKGTDLHQKILQNISKYLGFGIEISTIAIKCGVPETIWVGSEKFPVLDIHWIAGQYYETLCNYAGISIKQEAIGDKISVSNNLWNFTKQDAAFIIVEDEFDNAFEMFRLYATRAKKQIFINLICEDYILRDYMIDNSKLFISDSKAIPAIVPDFARTERNALMKVLMLMYETPIQEVDILNDFLVNGIEIAKEEIISTIKHLALKHCDIQDANIRTFFKEELCDNSLQTIQKRYYTIDRDTPLSEFAKTLRNCYFITEDEQRGRHSITSKLYNLIYQSILPGQFITYSGKHYEVQNITTNYEVVLRRAADHIPERRYYRQVRKIHISKIENDINIGATRSIENIDICHCLGEIEISTLGYFEMKSYSDFKRARYVQVSDIPKRKYYKKSILKVRMPDSTEKIRYTICVLLNEIFRTTYNDSCDYISATMPAPKEINTRMQGLVHFTELEEEDEDGIIYFIEDSQIDLGLIVSVERNFDRYMEIIIDFLQWHKLKMELPEELLKVVEKELPQKETLDKVDEIDIVGVTERMKIFLTKIFKRGKSTKIESKNPIFDNLNDVAGPEKTKDEQEGFEDGNEKIMIEPNGQRMYKDHHFLLYGFESMDKNFDIEHTIEFLSKEKYDENQLGMTRDSIARAAKLAQVYVPNRPGTHYCAFCGEKINSDIASVLDDGRERCGVCSEALIESERRLKYIMGMVMNDMRRFFGVKIKLQISTKLISQKKMNEHLKKITECIPEPNTGILLYSKKGLRGYRIFVEYGSPEIASKAGLACELTKIWQDQENPSNILTKNGGREETSTRMAMQVWTGIQYLRFLGKNDHSKRLETIFISRNDEFGEIVKKFLESYPIKNNPKLEGRSPFDPIMRLGKNTEMQKSSQE